MKKIILGLIIGLFFMTGCFDSQEIVDLTDDVVDGQAADQDGVDVGEYITINNVLTVNYEDIAIANSGVEEGDYLTKLFVKIANPTEEVISYNFVNFQAFDDKDNKLTANTLFYDETETPILSGDLAVNESIEGYIYFSVPEGRVIKQLIFNDPKLNPIEVINIPEY